MKFDIVKKASVALSKTGFKMKEHSPEILAATGVVSIVGSVVFACRATIKAQDILAETKDNVDIVHRCLEDESTYDRYNEEDFKKDLAIVYIQSGVKLAKAYAPAVALLGLGLGCLLKSNDILRKRNVALAAAYTAIDKGFKEYRERVVDRFGEDVDKELRYNIKAKQITEEVTDEETGKTKKVKKTIQYVDGEPSIYAKFFDEASRNWHNDTNLNLSFLKCAQAWFNDVLQKRGHVFLNEVYDYLDIPRTKEGARVGWVFDEKHPHGDNDITFGIYDVHRQSSRDFVNGYEKAILLDFNVDGVIDHLVEQYDFLH